MLNLIRMNFYRMSHSVSTWVILITMVVFMGLTVVTNCVLMKNLVNSDGTMKIESSESITEESTTTENTAEMVAEASGWCTGRRSSDFPCNLYCNLRACRRKEWLYQEYCLQNEA